MISSRLAVVALLFSVLFSSCKKSENGVAPYGKLKVVFSNEIDGQPIALGPLNYTNAAGNKYSVDLLKYYVSNVTLVKADASEKNFHNYVLIDASDSSSLSFTLDSVATGDYTSVKFSLGIDYEHNHTGNQEGALDPVHGMLWSWSTGYIFFKHEGNYKDSTGTNRPLTFHYATDNALTPITVPITKLEIAGNTRKLFLKFNLNSAYTTPGTIDFVQDNIHMSSGANDFFWLQSMKLNFADAFSYDKAE
jgi:hypothetical protein